MTALGLLVTVVTTQATPSSLDIAQKPLFLGGTDPNVLYILDDSGSMGFSFLPDSIGPDVMNGSECKSTGNFKRMTSSSYNQLYYDPNVTYQPPLKADGTSYPAASFTAALPDGFAASGSSMPSIFNVTNNAVNLGTSYRAFWGRGYSGMTPGEQCTYLDAAGRQAYYHVRNTSCANIAIPPDSCFPTTTQVSSSSGPNRVRPELGGIMSTDERTNFANWYSYYHHRMLTAKTGTARAFSNSSSSMNIGYMKISDTAIARGVRPFKDAYPASTDTFRTGFFTWLQSNYPNGGTPLRRALNIAGQYYETSAEPYNSKPWDPSHGNTVSCRQSYAILMTDGYWKDNAASTTEATNNTDSTDGGLDSLDGRTSFTFKARAPFKDGYSSSQFSPDVNSNTSGKGTLSDVAMYYWKRDLRSGLNNNVPVATSSIDKAFWQHMTTYTIGFGVSGAIDKTRAFNSILAVSGQPDYGYPTEWPNPEYFDEKRVDDLLHAAVNGHGGYFSAKNPTEFADALNDTLSDITDRQSSATAVSVNSARLSTDSVVYQATFNSGSWSGDVTGYSIDPSTKALTQIAIASTKVPSYSGRNILTWNPSTGSGTSFQWANLSSTAVTGQQARITAGIAAALGSASSITGEQIVSYIRGDRSREVSNGGSLRNRTSALGDIVNSDPVYAGKDDYGYASLPSISSAARSAYPAFVTSRTPMVYVGANDGMLHAFNGSNTASAALSEVFAYVPNNVLGNLPYLAKATDFSHKYFVDGPSTVGHAYLNGAWKTILIGSTGAGGKAYFAIDVTTPTSPQVLWEYTDSGLGNTMGKAAITRLNNGSWAAIFGNGYNSSAQTASLYVVDLGAGTLIRKLDVPSRDTTLANGLATPIEVDTARDGTTDLVYAGDLQGSLWKFDLSSTTTSAWAVSFGGKPLFQTQTTTTTAGSTQFQPVTSQPQVARHPSGGAMVYFGTGQFFETGDQSRDNMQSFYGVRDECLLQTTSGCNSISGLAKVTISELLQQTFTESTNTYTNTATGTTYTEAIRTFSKNVNSAKKGFYVNLRPGTTNTGERVVSDPQVLDDRVIFSSIIPNEDVCGFGGDSWITELDLYSGGATSFSVFDLNRDTYFNSTDAGNARKISGLAKAPVIMGQGGSNTGQTLTGTSDPSIRVDPINLNRTLGRQTWRQIR